jgi:DNA-binding phage protein
MTPMRKILTEPEVRKELEKAIAEAGGVTSLAHRAGISAEPIIRARKQNGAIRPSVLAMLKLRKRKATYERI